MTVSTVAIVDRRRQPFHHLSGVYSEALEPLAIRQSSHTRSLSSTTESAYFVSVTYPLTRSLTRSPTRSPTWSTTPFSHVYRGPSVIQNRQSPHPLLSSSMIFLF